MKKNIYTNILGLIVLLLLTLTCRAQNTIGYVQMEGNNNQLNLRVISVTNAIAAGNGVVKIALSDGTVGAADLVPTSDFDASEVRVNTSYGVKAWRKARVFGEAVGSNWSDKAFAIDFSDDGNLLVAGETWGFGTGSEWNGFLIENTPAGDINWAEVLGYPGWGDAIYSVRQTSDGEIIILGNSGAFGLGGWDFWISKLDASFNQTWGGGLGGSGDDFSRDIFEDDDGGFVFIGSTNSFPGPDYDVYMKKLDANGNSEWGWSYGTDENNFGFSTIKDVVPGYLAFGTTTHADSGDYDLFLRKFASDGTPGSAWDIGGRGGDDVGRKVVLSHDNKYVLSGYTDRIGSGQEDFFLTKRNTSAAVIWSYAYGGSETDKLWSMIRSNDDGFVMVGETESFGAAGSTDIFLLKVDSEGVVEWSWMCGGWAGDIGYSVVQDEFGFYYVAGSTNSIGVGSADMIIMKFSPEGTTCATYFSSTSDESSNGTFPNDGFVYRKIDVVSRTTIKDEVKSVTPATNPLNDRMKKIAGPSSRTSVVPTLTVICN